MSKSKDAQELEALESITPDKTLGMVDTSPKFSRDARLQSLEYIEIPREMMGYRGMFYPSDYVFKARAAIGAEMVKFSSIDDEDALSVNEGMNEMLKTCIRIESKSGKVYSYKNIYEFDRLWFLLYIRDLTMVNAEEKIVINQICDGTSCRHKNEIVMSYDNLTWKPLSEIAEKYYNEDEACFVVNTRSFGVMKFQPSTIFRAELFKDWIIEANKNKQQIDPTFIKLFWMFVNKDNQNDKDCIKSALREYTRVTYDPKLFSIYINLNKELSTELSQTIKYHCSACGMEGQADIQFPNGFSNFFIMSNIDSELL